MAFTKLPDREEDVLQSVEKYQSHFVWLRDPKFLQDLENDSVDSDIIEEELSALQEEEVPLTAREKVVKFLQSNPVQILLVVVVLLDAGIVIAQIVLDLNSVKEKLHRREEQLSRLLMYVKDSHQSELHGYLGHDVNHILQILEDHRRWDNLTDEVRNHEQNRNHTKFQANGVNVTVQKSHPSTISLNNETSSDGDSDPGADRDKLFGAGSTSAHTRTIERKSRADESESRGFMLDVGEVESTVDCNVCMHNEVFHASTHFHHVEHHEEHDIYHDVAHGLHFASIAIIGFLVLEDLIKIIAMGKKFFKHKLEIFDAIIIVASFISDIVFLGGVSGEEGQKAAAVLVILLIWRLARVVDGILITVKQRQEFRIRLQKRARRNAERKIDAMEEERHARTRQIQALKELCRNGGIKDEDIAGTTPRKSRRVSSTLCALTSVARLSVSMTMSMSSGLFSMVDDRDEGEKDGENKPSRGNTKSSFPGVGGTEGSPHHHFTRRALELASSPRQVRKAYGEESPKSHRRKNGRSYSLASPVKLTNIDHIKGKASRARATPPRAIPSRARVTEPRGLRRHSSHTSPVNSSGVEIVISTGSDQEEEITISCDKADPDPSVNTDWEGEGYQAPTFGLYPEDSVVQEETRQSADTVVDVDIVDDSESDAFLCAADTLGGDMGDDEPVTNSSQVYLLSEMS